MNYYDATKQENVPLVNQQGSTLYDSNSCCGVGDAYTGVDTAQKDFARKLQTRRNIIQALWRRKAFVIFSLETSQQTKQLEFLKTLPNMSVVGEEKNPNSGNIITVLVLNLVKNHPDFSFEGLFK